ncbi:hypothetical protein SVIOM342S_07858 [Streptomyces violaceorubidus]
MRHPGADGPDLQFPNAVPVDLVALEAIDGLDIEVVATLGAEERRLLTHVPDNVRLVDHVPLHALPSCAAIVHHGGAGTWSTALAKGVPQIAMGWIWDAIERARRAGSRSWAPVSTSPRTR